MRYYSVGDVVRQMGWNVAHTDKLAYQRFYQRVREAIALGHGGRVGRTDRSFVLTRDNVKRLLAHLKERWPQDVKPKIGNDVLIFE